MAFDLVEGAPAAGQDELYDLVRPIACNSIAETWLARTVGPEQSLVVVKNLLPHLAHDPEFIRIFQDELRLASALRHPDIARILDYGRSGQGWFVAIEHVSGWTLKQVQWNLRAQHKAMPAWLVLSVMISVSSALQAAHERRMLHRDVRPENIMLSMEGQTKVLDFGIARAALASDIGMRTIPRKLAYAAPEVVQQSKPASADARTDVYSAGVVLYEMLTGVLPFEGQSDFELARSILEDAPLPPHEAARWIPAGLSDIVTRAIARDPARRFSSAAELGNELESFMRSLRVVPTRNRLSDFLARLSGPDAEDAPASSNAESTPNSQRLPPPPPCFHPEDIAAAQGVATEEESADDSVDLNWDAFSDAPPDDEPSVRFEATEQPTLNSLLAPPPAIPSPPPQIIISEAREIPVVRDSAPATAVLSTVASDDVEAELTMQSAGASLPAAEHEPAVSSHPSTPSVWDTASQRTFRTGQAFDQLWQRPRTVPSDDPDSKPAALWDRVTAKARSDAERDDERTPDREDPDASESAPPTPPTGVWTTQSAPESSRAAHAWDRVADRQSRVSAKLPQLEAMDAFEQGLELVKLRKYDEALRLWERAIELDPENTRLVVNAKRLRDRLKRDR